MATNIQHPISFFTLFQLQNVAPLLWPSVGVNPNTWKNWELESSGTPECSELNSKGQNTLHWHVLGFIGKVLKRRYLKCPRIGNSDICNPSFRAKEGPGVKLPVWLPTTKSRESMPSRHPIWECDTALERSRRGLQLWFRFRHDPTLQSGVMAIQSSGSPVGTKSGLHFGSPGNLCHLDAPSVASCREYYREYGGGILPSQGCGESKWVRVPVACPNTKWVQMDSNQLVLVCDADSCDLKAWSLPILIPWLPTRPSTPF